MPVRLGIDGFGRTGRTAFASARERQAEVEVVRINDARRRAGG